MQLSTEYQELADFFANRSLPTGPQHINEYSVFLNLPGAVSSQVTHLQSEVATTQQSAALMLNQVRRWLMKQDVMDARN